MDLKLLGLIQSGRGSGGGSTELCSWSDITDKPFYEETTEFGDTLTWDGDTTGRVMSSDGLWVKVSDSVLTTDDLPTNITGTAWLSIYRADRNLNMKTASLIEMLENDGGGYLIQRFAVAPFDGYALTEGASDETILPEKGVYFYCNEDIAIMKSMTINDYNFINTDLKPLDEKFLPDTVATKEYVQELLGVIENGTY